MAKMSSNGILLISSTNVSFGVFFPLAYYRSDTILGISNIVVSKSEKILLPKAHVF